MANRPIPTIVRPPVPVLALRSAEAAEALGISLRLLSKLTSEGRIPHCRIGRVVLYPVRELQDWLSEQVSKEASS